MHMVQGECHLRPGWSVRGKAGLWLLSVVFNDGRVGNTIEIGVNAVDAFLRMKDRNSENGAYSHWFNSKLINAWRITKKQGKILI